MKTLTLCIRKDILEFLRRKRLLICLIVLFCIAFMVLGVTKAFPVLVHALTKLSPDSLSELDSLLEITDGLIPSDLKGNLGFFTSDLVVYYTIAAAFLCFNLIPSEIREGKWIIPLNCGIDRSSLLLSKCLVYGAGIGLPGMIVYDLYYGILRLTMESNCPPGRVLLNGLLLGFNVAVLAVIVILLSVIFRYGILSALTVILTVMVAPDVLSLFSFGRFLPTYTLSFNYAVGGDPSLLIIPFLETGVLLVLLFLCALRKLRRKEIFLFR